ncbi:hypothetical protein [Caviibacterium pharyngocola]|uniref:Ribbon-helix-helix protein, CopG family n=1 Tax=Caviibacterium pharyngocola TaxID=28159 RepID=A0A2M8RTB7_9PAST|nr:hypothetical protein [Caviibacterium pharyngocola]PJG82109.1 hypothetical protein CVP04_10665 [Caviibacterium pharyngocola]
MALSRTEIVNRSNAKRGIKQKAFKLHESTIELIEQLAKQHNIPQNQLIKLAVEKFAEKSV